MKGYLIVFLFHIKSHKPYYKGCLTNNRTLAPGILMTRLFGICPMIVETGIQ